MIPSSQGESGSSPKPLNQVVQELGLASTGVQIVLDLDDGTLFPVFDENPDLVPEDFHAREERGDFLFLPDAHDLNERAWMRRFAESREDRDDGGTYGHHRGTDV